MSSKTLVKKKIIIITGKIFGQNCDESFDGSEDGSVDDDGGLLLALVVDVTQTKPGDMKRIVF